MTEREKYGDYSSEESGGKDANERSAEKLFHLSNEFFHLVPLKDVDESTLKPIEVMIVGVIRVRVFKNVEK